MSNKESLEIIIKVFNIFFNVRWVKILQYKILKGKTVIIIIFGQIWSEIIKES